MTKFNINDFVETLTDKSTLREVESRIYSVLPTNKSGSDYDTQFGYIYDLIACNPIYNRIIWGYPVKIFSEIAIEALQSSESGALMDIGCGSLAFTAKIYSQFTKRPVILVDQSLKMLRMAKSRLMKQNNKIPENLILLHADALQLPFRENIFTTILSENLLHCLNDTSIFLKQSKSIVSAKGSMYFTTLVKAGRLADKYLTALADSNKLVSRTVADHQKVFMQLDLTAKFETTGNILVIKVNK